MSHEFNKSIKKDVAYCKLCCCLSYKNIPAKNVSLKNCNITQLDPLTLKYRPISLKMNLSQGNNRIYIAHRKIGLLKIYEISKRFDLEKVITFKAIGLMDKIYLNNDNKISIEHLDKIALISILLSFQFNNYFNSKTIYNTSEKEDKKNKSIIYRKNKYKNLIYECYQYIKTEIKNLIYWQMLCLECLNFNLSEFTALDYINLFFQLGVLFTKENVDIYNIYNKCLNLLEIIINNDKICNFNQYVVALSVLYINISNEKYFNKYIFKYIYGVDFNKRKYISCTKEIYKMISDDYNLNCFHFGINNIFINNLDKLYIHNILELLNNYYKNAIFEYKNHLELNFLNDSKNQEISIEAF